MYIYRSVNQTMIYTIYASRLKIKIVKEFPGLIVSNNTILTVVIWFIDMT